MDDERNSSGTDGVVGEEWYKEWIVWIVKNPWDFIYYLFLILSPLFIVSMIASWKLSKSYQAQTGKDKKRGGKKTSAANSGKVRTSRTLRSNSHKTD